MLIFIQVAMKIVVVDVVAVVVDVVSHMACRMCMWRQRCMHGMIDRQSHVACAVSYT